MNVLVIDGQGGQLGGQLIKTLKVNFKDINVSAIISDVMTKLQEIV